MLRRAQVLTTVCSMEIRTNGEVMNDLQQEELAGQRNRECRATPVAIYLVVLQRPCKALRATTTTISSRVLLGPSHEIKVVTGNIWPLLLQHVRYPIAPRD